MIVGVRRSRAVLVVVLLLVFAGLALAVYYLTRRGPVGDDEFAEPARLESRDDLFPAAGSDQVREPVIEEEAAAGGTIEAALGTIEIETVPTGVRLAVIGPDRFVHVHSWFGQASLGSLRPGTYRVLGALEGHGAASREVEVTAGGTEKVSLTLVEGEGR